MTFETCYGLLIHEQLLTEPECAVLRHAVDSGWDAIQRPGNACLHPEEIAENEIAFSLSRRTCRHALALIKDAFVVQADLLLESFFLSRLDVGQGHQKHADNRRLDGTPNHCPHRAYSAICYLNGDFTGAPIRFERLDAEIQPEAGLLVAFPSEMVHEVPPVESGARYSLPMWFTFEPRHAWREP